MTGNLDTIAELLTHARREIDGADAEVLLASALGQGRSWLVAHAGDRVDAVVAARFHADMERRVAGEPVAYLTGLQGFWSLDLEVGPDTLIPRPETELLVECTLARIPDETPARIADLGTGSGAIALAIASERPRALVIATDTSSAALDVAKRNAARHDIAHVEFRCGDWFAPLRGERFDIIASNPPYIPQGDLHLGQGDLRFEPHAALASGADGLDAIRTIAGQARAHLTSGGWLLLEHGWDQGDAVRALLICAGFVDVETVLDLENRDRVTAGRNS